jgi:hypothetical protein
VIPSPHTVQVRRWTEPTEPDEFGNLEGFLGDPQPWQVRSIDPVSNREPGADNRDLATIAKVIHADKSSQVPGYRDTVVVDGLEYPVDGTPDDWTRGPWPNPAAGVTVWLKRVEG